MCVCVCVFLSLCPSVCLPACLPACLSVCLLFVFCFSEKDYELHIRYRDYLRILADGNFLNVVCLVLDKDAKQAAVKNETIRLKVRKKQHYGDLQEGRR